MKHVEHIALIQAWLHLCFSSHHGKYQKLKLYLPWGGTEFSHWAVMLCARCITDFQMSLVHMNFPCR